MQEKCTIPAKYVAVFWSKVDKNGPNGCWLWTASVASHGYGNAWDGQVTLAHRLAYRILVGPIPNGLHIHHTCRNPRCVNPDHLELVTREAHPLIDPTAGAANAAKTQCPQGHPYDLANTYYREKVNQRGCRLCQYENQRRWQAAHKAEQADKHRRWAVAHKAERAEYNRRWEAAHKVERLEYQRRLRKQSKQAG